MCLKGRIWESYIVHQGAVAIGNGTTLDLPLQEFWLPFAHALACLTISFLSLRHPESRCCESYAPTGKPAISL
jgi:hypothetical protein